MVFRVQKNKNYTTMSNYHLRDKNLSLKAKGLLSWMLSNNDDWDYSIGNDGTFSGGDFKFDKEDGEYKVILDVSKHPYTVKFLSTSFPERLYVPGEYQVWEPANAPTLESDGEGLSRHIQANGVCGSDICN